MKRRNLLKAALVLPFLPKHLEKVATGNPSWRLHFTRPDDLGGFMISPEFAVAFDKAMRKAGLEVAQRIDDELIRSLKR